MALYTKNGDLVETNQFERIKIDFYKNNMVTSYWNKPVVWCFSCKCCCCVFERNILQHYWLNNWSWFVTLEWQLQICESTSLLLLHADLLLLGMALLPPSSSPVEWTDGCSWCPTHASTGFIHISFVGTFFASLKIASTKIKFCTIFIYEWDV